MLEFYGLPIIFKNLEYIKKVNMDIINKANLVRGIMYRTHYSQEYRKSSFERFEECFEEIFNNEQKRNLIEIKKSKKTDKQDPRNFDKIKKNPL